MADAPTFAQPTEISPYRAHMVNQAEELGWTYTQAQTSVDRFTKGTVQINARYGVRALLGFEVMDGPDLVEPAKRQKGQLQLLQTRLGRPMDPADLWHLSPSTVRDLKDQAARLFKVMDEAAVRQAERDAQHLREL